MTMTPPSKRILYTYCLEYYDGPLLVEGRDQHGKPYLATLADDAMQRDVWLVLATTARDLRLYHYGLIDLRAVMLGSDPAMRWLTEWPLHTDGAWVLRPLPDGFDFLEHVPEEGSFVDDPGWRGYSESLKAARAVHEKRTDLSDKEEARDG